MKAILAGMLLLAATHAIAELTNDPAIGLHNTTTFKSVEPWDSMGLLRFACTRSGMPFDISPKLFPATNAAPSGLVCNFRNTEVRYIMAWVVKFLNATARLETGTIVVRPALEQPGNDPIFDCTEETEGEWKPLIERSLLTPLIHHATNTLTFGQWIKTIAEKAECPLIVAPPLGLPGTRQPTLPLNADGQTCGALLKSGLETIGMTYRIQGGVVFITP